MTSFWRELFRVRSSNCQLNAFLTFQSFQRIFGNAGNCIGKLSPCVSKHWECFRTKPKYVENHLKIGPTHLQNIFQTLTTHLNSERTSHFLYQPRETTVSYYTLFMRRFCLHFDDCRNCRFASRRFLKCFTSNVRVIIIIIPATASAATAIINFKMKALHSMTCRVLS